GPRGREQDGVVAESEPLEALQAGGAAVAVGVDHQFGAAAQRPIGDGVHVADDHVGPEPGVQDRVGAAVDTDDHGPVLPQERPQGGQVLLVVVAAHDDQHRPAGQVGADAGGADAVEQQVAFAQHVLHGVLGELLELLGQALAGDLLGRVDGGLVLNDALADPGALAEHGRPVQGDDLPVPQILEQDGTDGVDQGDPGIDQDLRAGVGVPPGGGGGDVEHRRGTALDQGLGGDTVDVLVIDDGDVARREARGQVLGALSQAGRSGQVRVRGRGHDEAPCSAVAPTWGRASSNSCSAWARATSETSSPDSI